MAKSQDMNDLLLQKVGWIINNKDKGQIKLNKKIVECVKNYKEGIEQLQLRQDKNIYNDVVFDKSLGMVNETETDLENIESQINYLMDIFDNSLSQKQQWDIQMAIERLQNIKANKNKLRNMKKNYATKKKTEKNKLTFRENMKNMNTKFEQSFKKQKFKNAQKFSRNDDEFEKKFEILNQRIDNGFQLLKTNVSKSQDEYKFYPDQRLKQFVKENKNLKFRIQELENKNRNVSVQFEDLSTAFAGIIKSNQKLDDDFAQKGNIFKTSTGNFKRSQITNVLHKIENFRDYLELVDQTYQNVPKQFSKKLNKNKKKNSISQSKNVEIDLYLMCKEMQDLINENYILQKQIKTFQATNNKKIIYRNSKNINLERLLENERFEKNFLLEKLVHFKKQFEQIEIILNSPLS